MRLIISAIDVFDVRLALKIPDNFQVAFKKTREFWEGGTLLPIFRFYVLNFNDLSWVHLPHIKVILLVNFKGEVHALLSIGFQYVIPIKRVKVHPSP